MTYGTYFEQASQYCKQAADYAYEQVNQLKTNYPNLNRMDSKVGFVALGAISLVVAPLATLTGVCIGFKGHDMAERIYSDLTNLANKAGLETRVVAVGMLVYGLASNFSLIAPFISGVTAGVQLANLFSSNS